MPNVSTTPIGSQKQVALLGFQKTNVGDADGTLNPVMVTGEAYVAPYAGSVLGFSGTLSGALTTGSLVFAPTINGSLCPSFPDAASLRTNQQKGNYTQDARKANYTFNAGDTVGVNWLKTGTINPTTTDVNALLVVLFEQVLY
jgi:hypothetical protein